MNINVSLEYFKSAEGSMFLDLVDVRSLVLELILFLVLDVVVFEVLGESPSG